MTEEIVPRPKVRRVPAVRPVRRSNDSIVQPIERPLLLWLAARTPACIGPNQLTLLGVLGSLVVFCGYALTNVSAWFLLLASFGLALNWLGDSLDGTIARVRDIERPRFGLFVDHTTDLVSQVLILVGLGLTPFVSPVVAGATLVVYLCFVVVAFLELNVFGVLRISHTGLGPTELRLLLVVMNTVVLLVPPWPVLETPIVLTSADVPVGLGCVLLLLTLVTIVIRDVRQLSLEDPPRASEGASRSHVEPASPSGHQH